MTIIRDNLLVRSQRFPVVGLDQESGYPQVGYDIENEEIEDVKETQSWELTLLAGVGITLMALVFGTFANEMTSTPSEMCPTFFVIFFFGVLLIVAAGAIKAREASYVADLTLDDPYQESYYDTSYDGVTYEELRMKRQMEEIVKMVKSTIKVRCRYCGTLNEESATNCDACGAPL